MKRTYFRGQSGTWYNSRFQSTRYHNIRRRLSLCCCSVPVYLVSYEQICSAARDYSLCVRLHSIGMRPAVYCLLQRIGIPNERHDDDTEQISDTIDLVDRYRLRTDDVVRATCVRGVRATAVCDISSTEYTGSISTASTTATILLYKGSGRAGARGPRPSSARGTVKKKSHTKCAGVEC